MELIGLNVIEVEQVKSRKMTSTNGVPRDVNFARVKVEGGIMNIAVMDGVDIPEGWSGRAVCAGEVVSYATVWQNQARTRYAVEPVRIEQFHKEKQVSKLDVFSAFFGGQPSKPQGLQADSKGSQQH